MTVRKYLKLEISISSFKYCKDCKAKKDKLVPSVFGRIYSAPISLRFYLTFENLEDEGTIVEVKRLNPHHRMAPDFSKRSAQAEWQTNTNPLFRPLNENTEDAIIAVGNKRYSLDQVESSLGNMFPQTRPYTDKATNGGAKGQLSSE